MSSQLATPVADTLEVRAVEDDAWSSRRQRRVVVSAVFFCVWSFDGGNGSVRYYDDIVTALAALTACLACCPLGRARTLQCAAFGCFSLWLSGVDARRGHLAVYDLVLT